MKEVFDDKMEIESWVSTSQNMHFVSKALAESRPKHKAVAELVERFCPAWFQLPKHKAMIEPADLSEVDFFRDLGPNSRRLIKLGKDKQYKRTQKKVLDSVQDVQNPDEMYLLTLAGLAPIQKVHRLERMIPPEAIKRQD